MVKVVCDCRWKLGAFRFIFCW